MTIKNEAKNQPSIRADAPFAFRQFAIELEDQMLYSNGLLNKGGLWI